MMINSLSGLENYRSLSPWRFWRESQPRERVWVISAWVLTLLLSVGLGLASIIYEWSGLPLHFGGVAVSVTLYPPLIFCMLWVVWFGFWWGFIPAYLATFVLALYSGMPVAWSVLFAFSDPIGLAVFSIVFRAIAVPINLRSLTSVMLFVLVSFFSGILGSSGALIWAAVQGIKPEAILPIWQGWWLGAFLQNLFIVAPLLWLATDKVMSWRNRHVWNNVEHYPSRARVMIMTGILLVAVLFYLFEVVQLTGMHLDGVWQQNGRAAYEQIAHIQRESIVAVLWVVSMLIVFIAFFSYQLYNLWVAQLAQMAESEQRYRTLYTNTPVMLHSIDAHGVLVNVSNYWLTSMGYRRDEVIGKRSTEFLTPESRDYATNVVIPDFMQTGVCSDIAYQFVKKDGSIMDVLLSAISEKDAQGHVQRSLAVVQDVTERKKAQEIIQAARIQAEQASRTKSEFLANISHEIRTPMNSILGMSRLALRREMEPKQREYLRIIQLSGEHLLGIINDLLDSAKIEAGKLSLECIEFNLDDIKQKLINLVGWKALDKGIRFNLQFAADIPNRLNGDPMRLAQILLNYANNAIKFTEHGGVTVVACKQQETEQAVLLRFEVRDTGIGLDASKKEKLFQLFQQGDSTVTRQYGGSGLGLSICKYLAQAMRGEVGVESEQGKGSVFWFTAWLEKVNTPVAESANSSSGELALNAINKLQDSKVLVVDDNLFNQEVAREFLQNAGVQVCVANHGQEALTLLQHTTVDCVLMDIQMPVMDGIEATRLIRQNPKLRQLPIIALTANVTENDRNNYLAAGMDDFIGKPFHPDDFYKILTKWLSKNGVVPHTEEGIFNLRHLEDITHGSKGKMLSMANKFVEVSNKDIQEIEQAVMARNTKELNYFGHRLKSPAQMVGATTMAGLCLQLEKTDPQQQFEQARHIAQQLRPLLEKFKKHLQRWCHDNQLS